MRVEDEATSALVGAWRLSAYEDRETERDTWTEPFGSEPDGLAVYHPSGMLAIQVFAAPTLANPEYPWIGYLGRFRVRSATRDGDAFVGVVEHHLESASDPAFLTEDVDRLFVVSADRLLLGDDRTWRRVFGRVAEG
jgi:hypothetical protein